MPRGSKRVNSKKINNTKDTEQKDESNIQDNQTKGRTPRKRKSEALDAVNSSQPLENSGEGERLNDLVPGNSATSEGKKSKRVSENINANATTTGASKLSTDRQEIPQNKDDTVVLSVEHDDFELEELNVQKRGRTKSGITPKSNKKSKLEQQAIELNTRLSEQMEKLSKELASVKQQLQEKETRMDEMPRTNESQNKRSTGKVIKSPSTSTLYVPAVQRNEQQDGVIQSKLDKLEEAKAKALAEMEDSFTDDYIDKFIQQIRLGKQSEENEKDAGAEKPVHRRLDFGEAATAAQQKRDEEERLREETKRRIVEAEKLKAAMELPRGRQNVDDDDEFLHITCGIDPAVVELCEQGKFVDLEKLVPKQHAFNYREEMKLQVYFENGEAHWAPQSEKRPKIKNFETWERAFRIYVALYTRKNPERAAEIMQYIHTIQHASYKYVWDNVAYYDHVFRHNMQKFPQRNWGKTFTHMWNMALTDPIKVMQLANNNGGQGGQGKNLRGVCWRFNNGSCTYTRCRFKHQCSNCGGTSHGNHVCYRKGKRGENRNRREQQGGQTTQNQANNGSGGANHESNQGGSSQGGHKSSSN